MGASGGLGFFSMDDFYAAEYDSPFESSGRRNEVWKVKTKTFFYYIIVISYHVIYPGIQTFANHRM